MNAVIVAEGATSNPRIRARGELSTAAEHADGVDADFEPHDTTANELNNDELVRNIDVSMVWCNRSKRSKTAKRISLLFQVNGNMRNQAVCMFASFFISDP